MVITPSPSFSRGCPQAPCLSHRSRSVRSVRCRRTRARAAPSSWTLSSSGIFSAARRGSWEATPAYRTKRMNVHVRTSCRLARPNRQPELGRHGTRTVCGSSIGSVGSRERRRKKLPSLGAPGQCSGSWRATRRNTLVADQPRRLSTTALAAATGGLRGTTAPPPAQRAARSLPVARQVVAPLRACSGPEARSGSRGGRRAAAASPCGAAWASSARLSSARRSAHPARPARGMALAVCAALAPAALAPVARLPVLHSSSPPRRPPTTTICTACSARTSAAPRATSSSAPRCPGSSRAPPPQRRACPATRPGRPPRH